MCAKGRGVPPPLSLSLLPSCNNCKDPSYHDAFYKGYHIAETHKVPLRSCANLLRVSPCAGAARQCYSALRGHGLCCATFAAVALGAQGP